ncbi:hypothetical protein FQA39_LY03300 [Lamprigera yunnana]|nr:hypothetical protein FQA39_LY03300 [Lamprigera yunnana]
MPPSESFTCKMQMCLILREKDCGILVLKLCRVENKLQDGLKEDPDKRFSPRPVGKGSGQNEVSTLPCYSLGEDANKKMATCQRRNQNPVGLKRVVELELVNMEL